MEELDAQAPELSFEGGAEAESPRDRKYGIIIAEPIPAVAPTPHIVFKDLVPRLRPKHVDLSKD